MQEAARRLAKDGPNELPGQGPRSFVSLASGVLAEPMFLLLLAAAAIYVVIGDVREAAVLATSILVVILITVLQERRTDRALSRLRELSSPQARVLRDGRATVCDARELVPEDVILLGPGDRVPADAVLIESAGLRVDESLLSGESVAAEKHSAETTNAAADAGTLSAARVFAGTLVVAGQALARVDATGAATSVGRIGAALRDIAPLEFVNGGGTGSLEFTASDQA